MMQNSTAQSKRWHFWLLLVVLVGTGFAINWWQSIGEAAVVRQRLETFPTQAGAWRRIGGDERYDEETEKVLRADDYLSRLYKSPEGRLANFYVGYYASQRSGATYHSPLNCLPGAGWVMTDPAKIMIQPADGAPAFEANRFIVQKGRNRQLLIYWYQGRGRAIASEYWGKFYTILDSIGRHRSDGAMVRVMTSLDGADDDKAMSAAVDMAAQAAPHLSSYIPN